MNNEEEFKKAKNQEYSYKEYDELQGRTFEKVEQTEESLKFLNCSRTGKSFEFYHEQDCCEVVRIEDVSGDIKDLENSRIYMAEEVVRRSKEEDYFGCGTWTFYKFGTSKGYVTIRWLGESNGYYSESVHFREIK